MFLIAIEFGIRNVLNLELLDLHIGLVRYAELQMRTKGSGVKNHPPSR